MKTLLSDTLNSIKKAYGSESIMLMGSPDKNEKIEVISSGSLILDKVLGIGGYPRGRIIEIYGPESAGKTTLALQAIAQAQAMGLNAAFIDAEHAIDPVYAQQIGVNTDELILAQPDSGEQALDICEILIKSGSVGVVVVDSVAALVPEIELKGEMNDQTIGVQARLMSKALRKISGHVSKTNTLLIFINQLREKVGVIFGNPEITPGGRALKFYTSQRLEVRKGEKIKEGSELIGQGMNVKVVKNKLDTPYQLAQLELIYGQGIHKLSELASLACEYELIEKRASWYSYNNERIAQGKKALIKWLEENQDITNTLYAKIDEITQKKTH